MVGSFDLWSAAMRRREALINAHVWSVVHLVLTAVADRSASDAVEMAENLRHEITRLYGQSKRRFDVQPHRLRLILRGRPDLADRIIALLEEGP